MDFGRQRGFYLMERTDMRRWAVERRVVFWSSCVLMLPGVVVVFHILLDGAKRSYNYRDCCCFELPNSLNLYFQVFLFVTSSFSVVLTEVLVLRGIVASMRRQVLSFLFFSTTLCLSAAMVLSVWMGISLRMMTLSFSVMLIFLHLNAKLFADHPVHVCSCLVVAVVYSVLASSGQLETRWSMVSSKRHTVYFLGPRQAS